VDHLVRSGGSKGIWALAFDSNYLAHDGREDQ